MKFLVLSDLHASIGLEDTKDTRMIFDEADGSEFARRFTQYCKSLGINIDYLVCPGDISNKGCISAFNKGWEFINDVVSELSIKKSFCVPGNHDLQSRPNSSFSPNHSIKFSSPMFPTDDYDLNTHFWGWNWCHIEESFFNILMVNSSAYHGVNDEYKHGRIPPASIKQLSDYIDNTEKFSEKPFNILVCHHHPLKREDIDFDSDYEVMEGGQSLLKVLDEKDVGPWLIIHGHKHFASVMHAPSSRHCKPTVFSAGSFGAKLYPALIKKTNNQFYIIDVNVDATQEEGVLLGTFEAHSWDIDNNWHPSKNSNLPFQGGFGSMVNPKHVVTRLESMLEKAPYLDEEDLEPIYEMLKYCTPGNIEELFNKLEKSGLKYDVSDNKLIEVSK